MFIKSITLEGFKSYENKTEITQFDPYFNAITGLNGSGKSNILDAICFVMGITNLGQVRAGTLNDLIYKNGQTGVKKAIVTITFDNSDKSQSPVGYNQCKEIVISRQIAVGKGRNQYTINGVLAQNNKVVELFCTIKMNVNNPHFLIMQGQITKIINMKPPEILSLIQEAAGTSYYERKRISSEHLIVKKDSKLQAINQMLTEEIRPALHRLQNERKKYSEYTKHLRQIERFTKLQTAWEFVKAEEICNNSGNALKDVQKLINESKDIIKRNQDMIDIITSQLEELEKKKTEELSVFIKDLEMVNKKKQMEEAKANSDLKYRNECLNDIARNQQEILKNMKEDSEARTSKNEELEPIRKLLQQLEAKSKQDQETAKAAQKCFQDVSVGMSTNDEGHTATLPEQLMAAKTQIANINIQSKQAEMKWNYFQKELTQKLGETKKTDKNYKKQEEKLSVVEKQLLNLKEQLEQHSYNETKKKKLIKEIEMLEKKIDDFYYKYPRTAFEYSDPRPNFDRSTVKGLVCNLFTLKDSNAALALEVAAGNKLYNVVVEDAIISQDILQNGQLKYRVTFIPLHQIYSKPISQNTIQMAKRLVGDENVQSALSLIEYDPEMVSAMKFVFGNVLICTNKEIANAIAFNERISTKCVTLDGDVYNPAGILTGGSRDSQGSSILLWNGKHVENLRLLEQKKRELSLIEAQRDGYYALKNKCDLHMHKVEVCQESLRLTIHFTNLEDIKQLQSSIETQKIIIDQNKDKTEKVEKKVKELESKMKNFKQFREQELKSVEKKMNEAKLRAENSKNLYDEQKNESENLVLELEQLQNSLADNEKLLTQVMEQLKQGERQFEDASSILNKIRDQVAVISSELKDKKLELKTNNEDIQRLTSKKTKLTKSIEEKSLQIQQAKHDIIKIREDSKQAASRRDKFYEDHDWIVQDRQYFGMPGTQYDFELYKPKEIADQLEIHLKAKAELSQTINMRAHSMLDVANSQCQDVLRKKRIVENDKAKISKLMRQLDDKMKIAIEEAFIKVNKDFGSIFSTLLPGTKATLVPLEGQNFYAGLEVKVAFGDVWKDSVSELSGGQRSLVAMSLILALLLYKPAPIYILDEVDAALDSSHTHNIGTMLRKHFKTSQFIIVSLKEGMFNNANVLYSTDFVDGSSQVSRRTQKHK